MRYAGYVESGSIPNIVVDGSSNAATVLTLSHWPGSDTPPTLARDLSAQIAFAYLDDPVEHPPAEVVTNNHFDQDGLVSIFALLEPELARRHRELLVDIAAAGDFGTYRDRRAARASMTLAALARDEPPNCEHGDATDGLYERMLPELLDIVLDNDRYRDLWADEDAALTASEEAVASGRVKIDEDPALDLAVVTIADDEPSHAGHRFAHEWFVGLHPMAIHNATDRFRLLVTHGRRHRFVDRYETWVDYVSRPTLPRVDMRPLADELSALETGGVRWTAGDPAALAPSLEHDGESTIERDDVVAAVTAFLDR